MKICESSAPRMSLKWWERMGVRRGNLGTTHLSGESKAEKASKETVKDQPEQHEKHRAVSGAGSVRVLWAASNGIAD